MKKRICSRLLKVYTDEFMLNKRSYEDDHAIIKKEIDDFLPLVDPMADSRI